MGVRQEKEIKGAHTGKERVQLSACVDDMVLYREPQRCHPRATRAHGLGKGTGYKINEKTGRSVEKVTATHSSALAWRIPQAEEPGRLQSPASQRVGHD